MKQKELAELISKEAKVDEASARRALKALSAHMKEQLAKEERFTIPGLGSFIRKEGKEPGMTRILFKPFKEKEAEDA